MLHDFLSFAMGSWTSSLLPVGLNRSGQPTWESWGIRRIDPWKRNQTWFDPHHGELLTQIFPGFAARSSETIWSEAISLSIYWYIFSSSRSAAADGSIVLAQAALELLSWVYITEHKKSLSKEGMEKLSASDKFSILLSICGIPIEIPTNFTHLIAYAKAFNHMNGPKVITAVRNVLVYPDIKARGRKKGFDHGVGHPLLLLCNAKAPNY